MSGYGTLKKPNGDQYEGFWLNDKKNGKGKETFSSGDVFQGDYKNGKK